MANYLVRRILTSILVLFGVSVLVFSVIHLVPGDVTMAILGRQKVSEEKVTRLREQLGLNDPLYVQYGRYLNRALHGDLMIVQDYVPGAEYTLDIYRGRDGKVHCVVPRQRLAVRSGEVEKGLTVADADLMGFPLRATVSPRSLKAGGVELKRRDAPEKWIVPLEDAVEEIRSLK